MAIWSAEIKELEKLYESFKGQLPDLEKELERLIRADDENMILLYSRRCLEVIITDLCECELKRPRKTEPLKGIIDKLHKEEKVPSNIITSMDHLNSLSAYGAHPKDFDPEQVKPVLNNLDIIIKWYLKYKDNGSDIKSKPTEDIRQTTKITGDIRKDITISRKRLAGILGGLIGIITSVFAVLYFSNIIGSGKEIKELDKSIAVLPFDNLSNDPEQEYFSVGMVDELLDKLFKIGDLKVIARTSSERFKDTNLSLKEIARELGVTSIMEGSIRKIGNNVRITVQLIDAKTEAHLWSETYDKNLSDIFLIQTEVAQNVARELKTKLTSEEKEQIEKNQTQNTEAYNLYLQGRFFWNKRTEEGLRKSIEFFEKAISLDQNYALAIAGLADAYNVQAFWGWSPAEKGYAQAKELVERAIKVDNKLAEAHATLGNILCYGEWKWEEARKELRHAIELNPNYSTAHQYYSELLDIFGQNEEARIQINRALELDPYNLLMHLISAQYYYHEGNLNKSLEECFKLQELEPNYFLAYLWSFNNYIKQGDDLKAIEALQKIMVMDTLTAKQVYVVNDAYSDSGISGLINLLIELKHKMNNQIFYVADSTFYLAKWYANLDKKEKALDWLEKGIENHSKIAQINNDPDFNNLHSEPRFISLIKKMGLSKYAKEE
jgi:TolB-like protein